MPRGILLPYLEDWRKRRAMTQQRLASLSGVSVSTINRIERLQKRAEATTADKLAVALKVDPQQLMPPHDPPAPQ